MIHIGLDVHKDNITACVLTARGKVKFEHDYRRQSHDWDCLTELLEYRDRDGSCFMMEPGTYAYPPYRSLTDRGAEAHVVHVRSLKVITDSDRKTDRVDAMAIARMLRLWKRGELELSMAFMPTREQCELKDLCRYRERISKGIGDETRRIKSHMARNRLRLPPDTDNFQTRRARRFVLDTHPDDMTLSRRMKRLDELFAERDRIQREVESRLPRDSRVDLLEQIPGIGRQSAVQIMSMIVDVDRFPDAEHICAYFGMVPRVRDSSGKEHHGRMTKSGDRMMRMIMERATESHVRNCESSITDLYRRKLPEMGQKKALVTASRQMLSTVYEVLKRGTPFMPYPER